MITEMRVRNFRSFGDLTWRPSRLSLLTGPNNVGKTNLLYALRLLSLTAREEDLEAAAFAACRSVSEIASRRRPFEPVTISVQVDIPVADEGASFRYELAIAAREPSLAGGGGLEVVSERLERTDKPTWRPLIERTGADVRLLNEGRHNRTGEQEDVVTTAPPSQTMLFRLYEEKGNPSATAFKRFVRSFRYYHITADLMRREAGLTAAPLLEEDGRNFASVLRRISLEDKRSYGRLLTLVREIDGSIEEFEFIQVGDKMFAQVVYKGEDSRGDLAALSDGTMQYIAMCIVSVQSEFYDRRLSVDRPTLVMYEEPENGLYARALGKLFERLSETSRMTQTFITTHNPFLLDFFDDAVEDIFVLGRGDGGTEIRPANPEKVDRLLEVMSMGEMLYRGLLACE